MIYFKLKRKFAVAAARGDFSAPELKEVMDILQREDATYYGLTSLRDTFAAYTNRRDGLYTKPAQFVNGWYVGEKFVDAHEEKIADLLSACIAVKSAHHFIPRA